MESTSKLSADTYSTVLMVHGVVAPAPLDRHTEKQINKQRVQRKKKKISTTSAEDNYKVQVFL